MDFAQRLNYASMKGNRVDRLGVRVLKILIYGGCHARILRHLIEEVIDPGDVEVDLVVNYELIGSSAAFPEDRLARCDVLVYSPVENKGAYNTTHLLEYCAAQRIRAICFPWLEWHGYCPGAVKGVFKGRYQWFYPKLLDIAASHDTFNGFVEDVVVNFPDDATIDRIFAKSTDRLVTAERRHDMEIRVSDFVLERHRASRLFLISDHPSLTLYLFVVEQIAEIIGLPKPRADLSLQLPEPQWRWRTPILPRVEKRLNLDFTDTQWVDDELVAGRSFDLETYLRLYFHRDSVILGPTEPTRPDDRGDLANGIDRSARIVASPLEHAEDERVAYLCREHLAGKPPFVCPNETFHIDPKQWTSTWLF